MNQFNIKDIENLSGIKAHTWRMWEQRYGLGMPQRKESNHRFYDNENLKQILRISHLYHGGTKISKIATLKSADILSQALAQSKTNNEHEYFVQQLVEAAIDLDEVKFESILNESFAAEGVSNTLIKIIYPFQERIGMLWLTNHVVPSQEHFTSNILRQKISIAIDQLPVQNSPIGNKVMLFTPVNERHELPLQFVHYLLKENGISTIYCGPNVQTDILQVYSDANQFTHAWFHLITNFTHQKTNQYLQELCKLFPDKTIIMSGTEVNQVSSVPKNARILCNMNDVFEMIESLHSKK